MLWWYIVSAGYDTFFDRDRQENAFRSIEKIPLNAEF